MSDPEDPIPYTQAVHDAIAPIQHLEDDDMLCGGFAVAIEHRIERELTALETGQPVQMFVKYCKVCEETYRWVAVLSPFYEQAHRYRHHPDYICTFELVGSVTEVIR